MLVRIKQYEFKDWAETDWIDLKEKFNKLVRPVYRTGDIQWIKDWVNEKVQKVKDGSMGYIVLGGYETVSGKQHTLEFIIEYKIVEH